MPEMRFRIAWPDGSTESCYSPSLVIKDYFAAGQTYPLTDFLSRSRTALTIASERVRAKYGFPCIARWHSSRASRLRRSNFCVSPAPTSASSHSRTSTWRPLPSLRIIR